MAGEQLENARAQLAHIAGTELHAELTAKLDRNFGHLELENGHIGKALRRYRRSLDYFENQQEPNQEHVGIGHLHLAKALITQMTKPSDEPQVHLVAAERAFTRIGWIEGHARVMEQRARCFGRLAERTADRGQATGYLQAAWDAADSSELLFDRLRSRRFVERIEPIRDELRRIESCVRRKRRRNTRA